MAYLPFAQHALQPNKKFKNLTRHTNYGKLGKKQTTNGRNEIYRKNLENKKENL